MRSKITRDRLHNIGASAGIFFILFLCEAMTLIQLSEGGWK